MLIERFKDYLKDRDYSSNTLEGYLITAKEFIHWYEYENDRDFDKIRVQDVTDFVDYLTEDKNLHASTVNYKLYGLKVFNDFLIEQGIQKRNLVTDKYFLETKPKHVHFDKYTFAEVERLIEMVWDKGIPRDIAIVEMIVNTGLKIGELLNIRLSDYNSFTNSCFIRNSRSEKVKEIDFNKKVQDVMKNYLQARWKLKRAEKSDYLFISKRGNKLNRTSVYKSLKKYKTNITTINLRQYFFVKAVQNNAMSVFELMKVVGASSPLLNMNFIKPRKEKKRF